MVTTQFRAITTKRLRAIATQQLKDEANRIMNDFALSLKETIRQYPPEVPGSTYIRTFTLFNSWEIVQFEDDKGLHTFLINEATDERGHTYSVYVQGEFQQEHHAAHGWIRLDRFVTPRVREQLYSQLRALYRRASNAL